MESIQKDGAPASARIYRRGFSKGLALGLAPFIGVLLLIGGTLYGQSAGDDALFIDPRGWIGIGTNKPNATLDVAGNLNVSDSAMVSNTTKTGSLEAGTLNVTKDTILANTTIKGSLTTEGNVGIGTPVANGKLGKLDVRGRALVQSLSVTDVSGNPYVDNWIGMTDNFPDKIKWLHIGGITDGGVGSIPKKRRLGLFADITYASGNVGIGTADPKATLDVVGAIKATSINGEKPPLVFEVGQKGDTQKWHYVNQDIGPLCGDADGCTMKFFLRENSTDRVRTILEQIYIEQPDKSSNKTPGLYGHARQLGGGDSEFILQTANKYEIVPHPFDWIYVRNYQSPEVGAQSPAFGGYAVQFMTKPNVSATVIIYDR